MQILPRVIVLNKMSQLNLTRSVNSSRFISMYSIVRLNRRYTLTTCYSDYRYYSIVVSNVYIIYVSVGSLRSVPIGVYRCVWVCIGVYGCVKVYHV